MIFHCRPLQSIPRELAKTEDALARATDRFANDVEKAARRAPAARPAVPTRLPSARVRRPHPHPETLPHPRRSATAPSVLDRQRARTPLAIAVETNAQRAVAALRDRLLALRRGLGMAPQYGQRRTR